MSAYDLVVIGSGPAGEKGAAQAAYFGKRVALIEREAVVGGACINTGTVPSKTLRETALTLSGFRKRELYGVDLSVRRDVTIHDLMARERRVVEKEWRLIEKNLDRHHVDRVRGTASFVSAHEVRVIDELGVERRLAAEVFLIATGSSPFRPATIPFDDRLIYDSDTILKLDRLPGTMAVIGAGVIGCEYASIFAALGVDVHLIDGRSSLLPHVDLELTEVLLRSFRARLDIKLHLGSEVAGYEKHDERVTLRLASGETLQVERVLCAAGRQSNTASLNLTAARVTTGARGIIAVNDRYQTSTPNIYAAGDVIGFPALASTSMEQARVAMVHAFDLKYKTSVAKLLPYAIYTIPELSSVGETEQSCAAGGISYEIGRALYYNNARGQIVGDEDGIIKLIFDPASLRLLGVHIVGENASEIIHVGMMVMQLGGTINSFIECVFNFPTLSETFKYAAYDGLGRVAAGAGAAPGKTLGAATSNRRV